MKKLFLGLAILFALGVFALSRVKSPIRSLYDSIRVGQDFRSAGASEKSEFSACYHVSDRVLRDLRRVGLDLIYNECATIYTAEDTVTEAIYIRNFYLYPARSTGYGTTPLVGKTLSLEK